MEQVLVKFVEAQQQVNQQLTEAIQQLSQRPTPEPLPQHRRTPTQFLCAQTPEDDIEGFLRNFERIAELEQWPQQTWPIYLAPQLIGQAQEAYQAVNAGGMATYEQVKAAILSRMGATPEKNRMRFRERKLRPGESTQMLFYSLKDLCWCWLRPDHVNAPEVALQVLIEQFINALPVEIRAWVRKHPCATDTEVVTLVERFMDSRELGRKEDQRRPPPIPLPRTRPPSGKYIFSRGGRDEDHQASKGRRDSGGQGEWSDPPYRDRDNFKGSFRKYNSQITCFRCGEKGHKADQCNEIVPMQCNVMYDYDCNNDDDFDRRSVQRASSFLVVATGLEVAYKQFVVPIKVNGEQLWGFLDSGSCQTLIRAEKVRPGQLIPGGKITLSCVHGEERTYPTANIPMDVKGQEIVIKTGVLPKVPYPVLIGRDFPNFRELYETCLHKNMSDNLGEVFPFVDPDLFSGEGKKRKSRKERRMAKAAYRSLLEKRVFVNCDSGENGEGPTGPATGSTGEELTLTNLQSYVGDFKTEQVNDPTLKYAFGQLREVNGVQQGGHRQVSYPHFVLRGDLLYRMSKNVNTDTIVEQLVIPQSLRRTVLDLAHSHLFGGHLGVEKTQNRILQRFFWPGVYMDVKRYCASCPDCQKVVPHPHYRAPLVPLPIIETPFERIAMDLVGPVEKSARGYQHILVIVDYATRYPEAFPLRNTSTKSIASALLQLITRVGIPREILTDQGTPFMSHIMRDLCKLLGVKAIRTSVYHPQTDGLVERFNKTLKLMLRRVISMDGRDWDLMLPYLMFAVREVPQSSTGFSPFELLFARQPRGILDVAKEVWEEQPDKCQNLVDHVMGMRDRIARVTPIVKEHLIQAQQAQALQYNKEAKLREFQIGDRVLVLVSSSESKLLARWQGLYEIKEKVGPVNYKVYQPGRRKPYQIYHVNLLKAWVDREILYIKKEEEEIDLGPCVSTYGRGEELPEVSRELSAVQREAVTDMLRRNRDVFSKVPGRTREVMHDIITPLGQKVRQKPYRIPEAKRGLIKAEVEKMLEMGILEESHSEWNSPIILVPKPDGSIRFCNDYRRLNEISKFDSYPMPRVDDLIERLGRARCLTTLDLTKGYWQVPLTSRAREKTAFSTPEGLFQYTVLPFGLHGAPATFQRLMDKVLRPHARYAAAYLDDVVIQSADWESHLPCVQAVLHSLREAGLTANPTKCRMAFSEAQYLGYVIGRGVVKPQVGKVQAI
ncbi:uncharacterized protein LOC135358762 [Latimeria chalumnae]|uniref:uncharacterized protein LOC135358762 n=1 Tax=Latimeria chalumnae TaxID=7897 RepID=UPI00313D5545